MRAFPGLGFCLDFDFEATMKFEGSERARGRMVDMLDVAVRPEDGQRRCARVPCTLRSGRTEKEKKKKERGSSSLNT